MGVSTAGHLPSITSTSYPALTSHLLSTYNAQRTGNWTVSIRMLRSVLAGSNAGRNESERSTSGGNAAAVKAKLMYVVQMSEFPEDTFVLIEDPQRDTRSSIRGRHALAVMQAAVAQSNMPAPTQEASEGDSSVQPSQPNGQQDADANVQRRQTDGSEEEKHEAAQEGKTEQTDNVEKSGTDDRRQDKPSAPVPLPPSQALSVAGKPTRHTLFVASAQYMMLLGRLNLPAPLGAPSMGDGTSSSTPSAGPGAWLPRGVPVIIQGATYDIPSATGYGSGGAEWRVRLGMVQSGGTRGAGAIVENEYLPLLRLASDAFLTTHLHNLFPPYLTASPASQSASQAAAAAAAGNVSGLANPVPTPEQWQEVIPASNEAWMESVGISNTAAPPTEAEHLGLSDNQDVLPLQRKDHIGWRGKERGRRLAYLYITLLRNQSVI